jgi:hypothetical protein
MALGYPEAVTPQILQSPARIGHALPIRVALLCLTLAASGAGAQETGAVTTSAQRSSSARWWQVFAAGFASSILAHEASHVAAAYAVGGRPSFGFNDGRPTIYSGIDATLQPHKQFVFSSAGLTVQSLIDEGILDAPHAAAPAGPFARGMLAGGIATSFFYVTIGRNGSVSDVDFMQRTSHLSKAAITAIYGGVALVHTLRIAHDTRYANFFAQPDPIAGMRVGLRLDP